MKDDNKHNGGIFDFDNDGRSSLPELWVGTTLIASWCRPKSPSPKTKGQRKTPPVWKIPETVDEECYQSIRSGIIRHCVGTITAAICMLIPVVLIVSLVVSVCKPRTGFRALFLLFSILVSIFCGSVILSDVYRTCEACLSALKLLKERHNARNAKS